MPQGQQYGQIAFAVQHQCGCLHFCGQHTRILPSLCANDGCGALTVTAQTLVFVEQSELLGIAIRHEATGEHRLHTGVVAAPAQFDEF